MTKQQHQADNTIHEDQLLNFLVNALTGAFAHVKNKFIRMVTRAAWNALSVRREIPANKPPDDRFTR